MIKAILVFCLCFISDIDIESAITDDIVQIYHGVQHCLELRKKYILASLQRTHDNPKNSVDHWNIYPPPPKPRWTYNSEDNTWQDHKHEYTKYKVGEEFEFKDCEIPGSDNKIYKCENGVFQVYANESSIYPFYLIMLIY